MSKTQQEYFNEFETIKKDPKAKKCWWYHYLCQVNEEQLTKYMETFDELDKENQGTLEIDELKKVKLIENKTKLPEETIGRLITAFTINTETESIDRIEFIGFISFLTKCMDAFETYDTDKSNSLELSECKKGVFDFIVEGITDLSIDILLELNGIILKGKDEKSLTKIQFVGCCAYLAQCYSIFQSTLDIDRNGLENKRDAFIKFIEMILILLKKE